MATFSSPRCAHGAKPACNDLAGRRPSLFGKHAVVTTVDLEQLDGAFCGREFDQAFLAELPGAVDPCGENGEFHTLCHDGPLFSSPMPLEALAKNTRNSRFRCQDFRLR